MVDRLFGSFFRCSLEAAELFSFVEGSEGELGASDAEGFAAASDENEDVLIFDANELDFNFGFAGAVPEFHLGIFDFDDVFLCRWWRRGRR